jgi:hypothetical protein
MPDMRCRLARPVLAIAYVLSCQPPTHAQVLLPAANPEAQNVNACTPSPVDKRPSGPEVAIAELRGADQLLNSLETEWSWAPQDSSFDESVNILLFRVGPLLSGVNFG